MIEIDAGDELNIQFAILRLMTNRRVWTNAELKRELRRVLPLSAYDKSRSPTRRLEARWENRVNNALSPSRKSSLYAKGQVANFGRGQHKITDAGWDFINEVQFDWDDLIKGS